MLEAEAVGEQGRRVRCVSCGHTWVAQPVVESIIDLFPENENKLLSENAKSKRFHPSRWIVVALLLIGLMSLAIVGRDHVIRLWPPASELYKELGLPVEAPGTGLALKDITVIPIEEQGKKSLVVKGMVTNMTSEIRYLPPLRVRAYGKCSLLPWWERILVMAKGARHSNSNLCVMENWKHILPETRLFPGERAYFETEPQATRPEVTDLTISF